MNHERTRRRWLFCCCGLGLLLVMGAALLLHLRPLDQPVRAIDPATRPAEASEAEVRAVCAACHAYPPPETFPRHLWRREVKRGYEFLFGSDLNIPYPSLEAVALYYESRAPRELPAPEQTPAASWARRFEATPQPFPGSAPSPAVSHTNLVHLSDKKKLDLLVCEMRTGEVLALTLHQP
jgi:hypothetical protein